MVSNLMSTADILSFRPKNHGLPRIFYVEFSNVLLNLYDYQLELKIW